MEGVGKPQAMAQYFLLILYGTIMLCNLSC